MATQLVIEKTYKYPVDRIYQAFTDPQDLVNWYSAGGGWTTPYAKVDLKVGGKISIGFADPEDKYSFDYSGTFTQVKENELIEYVLSDDLAETTDKDRKVSVEFSENGDSTDVVVSFDPDTTNSEEMQLEGWTAIIENLETYLNNNKGE